MRTQELSRAVTLVYSDQHVAILRMPMSGSCSVPLTVTDPPNVELLGWAFTNFGSQAISCPACLLMLGSLDKDIFPVGGTLGIRTHIHDLRASLIEAQAPLSSEDVAILAKILLMALSPANALRLSSLLPLLVPGLDAIAAEAGAVACHRHDDTGALIATGVDFIPGHLLARTPAGYVHRSIDAVQVRAGSRTVMTLGSSRRSERFDRAILIGTGCYAVAQIAGTA